MVYSCLFRGVVRLEREQPVNTLHEKLNKKSIWGGIAQLGERLNGIQEVSGSIPLISTTKKDSPFCGLSFFALGCYALN